MNEREQIVEKLLIKINKPEYEKGKAYMTVMRIDIKTGYSIGHDNPCLSLPINDQLLKSCFSKAMQFWEKKKDNSMTDFDEIEINIDCYKRSPLLKLIEECTNRSQLVSFVKEYEFDISAKGLWEVVINKYKSLPHLPGYDDNHEIETKFNTIKIC